MMMDNAMHHYNHNQRVHLVDPTVLEASPRMDVEAATMADPDPFESPRAKNGFSSPKIKPL